MDEYTPTNVASWIDGLVSGADQTGTLITDLANDVNANCSDTSKRTLLMLLYAAQVAYNASVQ